MAEDPLEEALPDLGPLPPFRMERWQSLHEHRVDYNLSDSGVHPYNLSELAAVVGVEPGQISLGYVQTNGTEELRARIAALYPGAGPENVVVTTGGAEANFLAAWELLSPGDRAVYLLPTYGQTPGLAEGMGAEVVGFSLREELGWQPEPGAAAEAVSPSSRLLAVTNPNNPTGSRLSGRARREVVDAASRAGAWLLSDEVYAGSELDGEETPTLWGESERVVVTGSLSKAYGLPGLRLGWAVAPRDLARRLWARKDYTTIAPAAVSERLAAAALREDRRERILERTRRILRTNLDRLAGWLDERSDLFRYRPPEAGAICFVRYLADVPSAEVAERLRREESVLLVPGSQFGMEGFFRVGFGNPAAELEAALGRAASLFERVGRG